MNAPMDWNELRKRIASGDPDAVGEAFRQLESMSFILTSPGYGRAEILSDIFDRLFVDVLQSGESDKLDRIRHLGRFCSQMALNLSKKQHLSGERRFRAESGAAARDDGSKEGALEPLIRKEEQELLDQAVSRLNRRERLAFILKVIEGRSLEETAELVSRSGKPTTTGAVMKLVKRARRKLREFLDRHFK